MKKLKVNLSAVEEADSKNGLVVKLWDCGRSGERYDKAIELLDSNEEDIQKYLGELHGRAEPEDIEICSYTMGPFTPSGFKFYVEVVDEEKGETVHESECRFKGYDTKPNLDSVEFAEDFPDLLKQQIQTIVKSSEGVDKVVEQISDAASCYELSYYRTIADVNDDNIYLAEVLDAEFAVADFEIELDDNEKFDTKKLWFFDWRFCGDISSIGNYSDYVDYRPKALLLLYGNKLYYGYINDCRYVGGGYGVIKFKSNNNYNYIVRHAGFGNPLADGKTAIVGDNTKILCDEYNGDTTLTTFQIPDTVKTIEYRAFKNCTNLASITIPEGVTKINFYAFEGCTALTSVTIPKGVTRIDYCTFEGCTALTSINIPEGVTEIGISAFRDCTALTSVTIPGSVTEINSDAFMGCTALTSITIPGSVTEICKKAFMNCAALTSVTISEGVTKIAEEAFIGCI